MAIELIPKPKIGKTPFNLAKFCFYLSIIFLILSIASYFLLSNFQKKASKISEDLEIQISSQIGPEEEGKISELKEWRPKIEDYGALLNQHQISSNAFPFLEKLTYPKVWFTDFSLNSETQTLQLQGIAQSFKVLGEQLSVLKNDENIEKVDLASISLGEEGINFSFDISLSPKIFKP